MRIKKDCFLLTRPIAHRGLWGNGVVENSLTAYKNAAEKGYPIEIDLFLTTDGEIVTFHDDALSRMTGADGKIYEKTLKELKALSLGGTDERIPTFAEVLSAVNGKVPLLIEIKDQPNDSVVDIAVAKLKEYVGEFAVQSFNPFYVKRVKRLAPEFIRGILATDEKERGRITNFVLKYMPFNFMIKPDFIAYKKTGLKLAKRKAKKTPLLAWTITNQAEKVAALTYADNIIFENFIP